MTTSQASCFAENDPHTSAQPANPSNPSTPSTNANNTSPAVAGGNFAGSLDYADCNAISGWVVNRNKPNSSTKYDVYVNGKLAAVGLPATLSRPDVANVMGISGYNAFGFYLPIPSYYSAGEALTISVKYYGTQTDIPGSPVTTAACPVQPYGCSGDASGRIGYAESTTHTRSGGIALQLGKAGRSSVSSLTSKLIPVRKGLHYALDAYAYTPASVDHPDLTPQISSAVAGGVLAGVALAQPRTSLPDQPHRVSQTVPILGVSTALMLPLVKSLLSKHVPNARAEMAFYDLNGRFMHRQQVRVSNAARSDWEPLHMECYAGQDGYVAIRLQNQSKTPVWFDDIAFQARQRSLSDTTRQQFFTPTITQSKSGFPDNQSITNESLRRNCAKPKPKTIDGGTLDVDATVVGHRNTSGYEDGGAYGWGTNFSDSGTPGSGSGSGSTGGSGNGSSGSGNGSGDGSSGYTASGNTFTPNGAPPNPKTGQEYKDPKTGAVYVWDGTSWAIPVAEATVRGQRPTNPTQGQIYVYADPDFGYTTVYEYVNSKWVMPLRNFDENVNNTPWLPKKIKTAQQSIKDNACKTFRAMWDKQNDVTHKEQAAFITDKGVFWLSDIDNEVNKSFFGGPSDYSQAIRGKLGFVKDGVTYTILASIHTHPIGPQWKTGPSDDDLDWSKLWGIPSYIIDDGGIFKVRANGTHAGVIESNYSSIFNCALDQNIIEELR